MIVFSCCAILLFCHSVLMFYCFVMLLHRFVIPAILSLFCFNFSFSYTILPVSFVTLWFCHAFLLCCFTLLSLSLLMTFNLHATLPKHTKHKNQLPGSSRLFFNALASWDKHLTCKQVKMGDFTGNMASTNVSRNPDTMHCRPFESSSRTFKGQMNQKFDVFCVS